MVTLIKMAEGWGIKEQQTKVASTLRGQVLVLRFLDS